MRKENRSGYRCLQGLNSVDYFQGIDFSGVPLASNLGSYETHVMPRIVELHNQHDGGDVCTIEKTEMNKNYQLSDADPCAMASRLRVTQCFEESALASQQMELVVASKKALETTPSFDHASPTCCDEGAGEKCLFVMKFTMRFSADGTPQLEITHRGVHPDLRRRGVMKTASTRALLKIYQIYGDMEVVNHAIHIATASFFATTQEEQDDIRTHPEWLTTSSYFVKNFGEDESSEGRLVDFDGLDAAEVGGGVDETEVAASASGWALFEAKEDNKEDGDDVSSTGAEFEVPCQRGIHCSKPLSELLKHHCPRVGMSWLPRDKEHELKAGLFSHDIPTGNERVMRSFSGVLEEAAVHAEIITPPAA